MPYNPYGSAKAIQAQQNLSPVASGGGIPGLPRNVYASPRQGLPSAQTDQLARIWKTVGLPPHAKYPYGDPALLEMIRKMLMQDLQGREHSTRLAAELRSGGDPYLSAYAGTQSRLQGQGALARALSDAQLRQALQAQGFDQQVALLKYQAQLQKELAKYGQPGAGAYIGQALGTLGGAFLPGLGGGGGGGGYLPYMGSGGIL